MVSGFLFLLFFLGESEPPPINDVNILEVSDEMRRYVYDHVAYQRQPYRQKMLERLMKVIFSKDYLQVSYDSAKTHTAIETFRARSGNCLSYSCMFVAMARELGFDARFQEVIIRPNWEEKGDMIVFNLHVNVAVKLGFRWYQVDFNPDLESRREKFHIITDKHAKALYFNNIGAEHLAEHDTNTAIRYFEKAIDLQPKISFVWSNLGAAYTRIEHYPQAEEAYLKALNLNQSDFTAMSNLARLYRKLKRDDEAQKLMAQAQHFVEKNPYYHRNLAERLMKQENYRQAIAHYENALKCKPEDSNFYFGLAKAHAMLGDRSKVVQYLKRAKKYAQDEQGKERYSQKLAILASNN